MKRLLCLGLVLSIGVTGAELNQQPDLTKLRYLTEDYPPFNYQQDNQVKGISIDLLKSIWQRTRTPAQHIELLPWARAYHELSLYPNTVLFAVAKTEARKDLFKWACPIVTTRYALFAKKSDSFEISSAKELNKYTIGTIRADVGEQALLGILDEPINILSNVSMRPNLELMDKGRVHMVAYDEVAAPEMFIEFGRNPDDFEQVFTIVDSLTCFAFNLATNDAFVAMFQQQLQAITSSADYHELVEQHFHISND